MMDVALFSAVTGKLPDPLVLTFIHGYTWLSLSPSCQVHIRAPPTHYSWTVVLKVYTTSSTLHSTSNTAACMCTEITYYANVRSILRYLGFNVLISVIYWTLKALWVNERERGFLNLSLPAAAATSSWSLSIFWIVTWLSRRCFFSLFMNSADRSNWNVWLALSMRGFFRAWALGLLWDNNARSFSSGNFQNH